MRNLLNGNFPGDVYPVNISDDEVHGLKAHKSILDVPGEVDLAAIIVPAKYVKNVVKECANKGVKTGIIISSGFSEIGNNQEENEIVRIANEAGMRILGPNVFGLWSAKASLNATFGPQNIHSGEIAIVTQSGALGIAMIGKTIKEGIGLSTIVSVGNKSDINEVDLLRYLARDDDTKVIFLYIEGVKEGHDMVRVLKEEMPSEKPVVVLKAGKSEMGKRAAASHTGSMAGSDRVFDAAVKQTGMFRANSLEQAFDWIKTFARSPLPQKNNAVIVTNGGGIGVMATDACEEYGVPLYNDQEILKKVFKPATPDFGSTKNPVDITGNALGRDYTLAMEAAFKESSMGGILALYCETGLINAQELADEFIQVYKEYGNKKPVTYSLVGGEVANEATRLLQESGLPVFSDVEDAVSAISVLYRKAKQISKKDPEDHPPQFDEESIRNILEGALDEGRKWLLADEVRTVFETAGVPMAKGGLAKNLRQAVTIANEVGYPVVLKISSEDIVHKSDAGGVALDLDNETEVIDAYEAIIYNCRKRYPKARIRGIEVMEMAPKGVEIIAGGSLDPSFGPVVMFGLGGIYVEVMKDISFRLAPATFSEVRRMISEIRSYPLLLGVRGEKRKDIGSITDAVYRVGLLMDRFPNIQDLDINPLRVYDQGKGVKALDGRIMVKEK